MLQPTIGLDQRDSVPTVKRRGLLEIAWGRKRLVGLGLALGLVAGLAYYAVATPMYQSKAQLLIVKKRPDSFTGIDTRNLSIEDYVATHKTLLESPTIIDGAMRRGNLSSLECFSGHDDVNESIQKSLVVTRNRSAGSNNNVLDLSFRATRPADSAAVLAAIIDSYNEYLDVTYRNISDDTLKLITQAREVLEQDLKKQEAAYRTFRQKAPLLLSRDREGANVAKERLSGIEAKRAALLVRKAELQGYLQTIDAAKSPGDKEGLLALLNQWTAKLETDMGGSADRVGLNNQLFTLLQEEQKLLEYRGENHIEVKMLRQRIDLARKNLASPGAVWQQEKPDDKTAPVALFRDYFSQQLRHIDISEKLLADLYKEQFAVARELANFEVEDERLRRDINGTEKLLDSIIKKLEDAQLVKNVGGYDAKTIAPVTIGKKVQPSLSLILPAALLIGGIFGLGLAYFTELTDKTFRNVEEIGARLGLPLAGKIPHLKTAPESPSTGPPLDPILCCHHRPNSPEAEAYRGVRTALLLSPHGKGRKIIEVTSPNGGDGKSTLAANLAISIAQSGKNVLLLDADMRTPSIHRLFGLKDEPGLASVLADKREPKEAIRTAAIPGLSVLPAGPLPPNPAELLMSPRFQELLHYLGDQYDFVIIDSPPLLPVSDASIIAHQVDGVFLNVRPAKNARPDTERAKNLLANAQANIIGVVVNDAELLLAADEYGSGYTDHYRQPPASPLKTETPV